MKSAILLAVILATVGSLLGELPPWVYKERQDKAPETLIIKVRSVSRVEKKDDQGTTIQFTVEAEIQKVERSATKLAPGMTITIVYSQRHYSQPIVGPSEVPTLKEGQIYPAYLSVEGKTYSPAAGGHSFEAIR